MASLSKNAKEKVSLWSDQYDLCSGVALLKIIIRESHLDTKVTTNQILTKLSNLDDYILTVEYVKLLIKSLTARIRRHQISSSISSRDTEP